MGCSNKAIVEHNLILCKLCLRLKSHIFKSGCLFMYRQFKEFMLDLVSTISSESGKLLREPATLASTPNSDNRSASTLPLFPLINY